MAMSAEGRPLVRVRIRVRVRVRVMVRVRVRAGVRVRARVRIRVRIRVRLRFRARARARVGSACCAPLRLEVGARRAEGEHRHCDEGVSVDAYEVCVLREIGLR